jgi:type IV pilus assembly protein PilB
MEAKKLGEILLEEGMINEDQLEKAVAEQLKTSEALGNILVKQGFITEDVLYHFLAMQVGTKYIDVNILHLEEEIIKLVTPEVARKYRVIPIEKKPGKIIMATSNPLDPALTNNLRFDIKGASDLDISFVVTSDTAMTAVHEKYYPTSTGLDETISSLEGQDFEIQILDEQKVKDDEGEDDIEGTESPVVKYVNYLIEDAANKRASDIHINPYEKKIVLRYRIDGSLVEMPPPKIQFRKALTSRVKLLAGMNIIEKRKPQDGRIKFRMSTGNEIDLRASTIPAIWGENIVMRIINQASQSLALSDLGMSEAQQSILEKGLGAPYGMVLITGPTGSGKTTTVYAAITKINDPHDNIMTVEDPVEYRLPHLIQVQVNPTAELTFANVLRSFLRQDPDVMLVGEIRDDETASIAIKAALTGHLVLSTVHTNDAPSTITRLIDMGIDPIYVGSSVLCTVGQKLVRCICANCKEKVKELDLVKAKKWGIPPEILEGGTYYEGAGCPACHYTGYKGRMAAYEVLHVNNAIREAIFKKATLNELKRVAWENGMLTIRESAV